LCGVTDNFHRRRDLGKPFGKPLPLTLTPRQSAEIAVSSEKGKRKREGNHGWTQRGKPQPNDFNYGLTPMDTDFTEENKANGDVEMAAERFGRLGVSGAE